MSIQTFEQVLVDGSRNELIKFGNCKYCVVVDWRDSAEQILEDIKRHLPEGYLRFRQLDGAAIEIEQHGVTDRLNFLEGLDTELILQALNRVLSPEHEMRIFTPNNGRWLFIIAAACELVERFCRSTFFALAETFRYNRGTDSANRCWNPSEKPWWEKLIGQ